MKLKAIFTFLFFISINLFAADYYWVGGSGNWTDNSNHWATTSGGTTFHVQPPTQFDNVIFDENSFQDANAIVTLDVNGVCANMNWTGAGNSPTISGTTARTLSIYGSLTLIEQMNFNVLGDVYFKSETAGNTVTSASQSFRRHLHFEGAGSYILEDDVTISSGFSLLLTLGSLDLNNKSVTATRFLSESTNVRSLNLRSSTITLNHSSGTTNTTYAFSINGTNLTFNSLEPEIIMTGARAYFNNSGIGFSFHNITSLSVTGETRIVSAGGSFNSININNTGRISSGVTIETLNIIADATFSGDNNKVKNLSIGQNASFSGNNGIYSNISINGNGTFAGNNGIYSNVSINGNGTFAGNNTFENMVFTAGKRYIFTSNTTQNIVGSLTAEGSCAEPIVITSSSVNNQATISKESGIITINRVNLQDINATGGATFVANDAIDFGNNTGWTINEPSTQNLYWVGGTGSWEDINNWSDQSGGEGGYCVPTKFDVVIFDQNSFDAPSQVVTINGDASANAYFKDMIWTGVTNTPTIAAAASVKINVYGSLTLVEDMLFNVISIIYFQSNLNNNTITTAGQTFKNHIYFQGEGKYTLLDDLAFSANNILYFNNGTLDLNDKNVTLGRFLSETTNERTLLLTSSNITAIHSSGASTTSYAISINGTNMSFDAGTSNIILSGARGYLYNSGTGLTFNNIKCTATTLQTRIYANGASFNNVETNNSILLSGGNNTVQNIHSQIAASIHGNNNNIDIITVEGDLSTSGTDNTFITVIVNGTATLGSLTSFYKHITLNSNASFTNNNTFETLILTGGNRYTLTAARTITITENLIATGSCIAPIIIESNSTTVQAAIAKESGTVTLEYVTLQGINATGGANFIANEASDAGNNTGWVINLPSPKNIYWVGGTGNWEDSNNWSDQSGGTSGYCIPSRFDNVFFDENSFTQPNQIVTITGDASNNAYVVNMSWAGATNNPQLSASTTVKLFIHGSLELIENMAFNVSGDVYFNSDDASNTIKTATQTFKRNIYFQGNGGYTLADNLSFAGNYIIYFENGTLNLGNNNITAGRFWSTTTNQRTLNLGSSVITLSHSSGSSTTTYAFQLNSSNLNFNAGTSTIELTGLRNYLYVANEPLSFYNVTSTSLTGDTRIVAGKCSFNNITTANIGRVSGGDITIAELTINGAAFISNNNNIINKLTVNGTSSLSGDNTMYGDVVLNSTATIGGNSNYDKLTFNGNASITGNNTINTLELTEGNQYTLTNGRTQTITGSLTANGSCASSIIIKSSSTTAQSTIHKELGEMTLTRVNLEGINATGGALFTANDAIDSGNNSGWTINEPSTQNLYWVGGTGNWDDINNWSATSGGVGGFCVPTKFDNVIFDENSFSEPGQTVTITGDPSGNVFCMNLIFENINQPAIVSATTTTTLYLYGSLTLHENISFNYLGDIYFDSPAANTITLAGNSLKRNVYLQGTGSYTLVDDFTINGTFTFFFNNGGLNLNSKNFTVGRFLANNTNVRTLNIAESTITLSYSSPSYSTQYAFLINGDNLTFTGNNSTIVFTGIRGYMHNSGATLPFHNINSLATSGSTRIITSNGTFNDITIQNNGVISGTITAEKLYAGAGASIASNNNNIKNIEINGATNFSGENGIYGNVILNGNATIGGSNTFNKLTLSPGGIYTLTANKTQTIIEELITNVSCGLPLTIKSNSTTVQSSIYKESGIIRIFRTELSGINATGDAEFVAEHSLDAGLNSGWIFEDAYLSLYWVGGTGNWNDNANWSATSGGEGGYCIPSKLDNVVFDENSFTQTAQTVTININAECRDMNWVNASNNPVMYSTTSYSLYIYGSLFLKPEMDFAFNGRLYFQGVSSGEDSYMVANAGKIFKNDVHFNGVNGAWTLMNDFNITTSDIYLNHGTLHTNDKNINARRFISNNNNERTLNLGASTYTIGSTLAQAWYVNGNNMTINPGTSTIELTPATTGFWSNGTGDVSYNNVVFTTSDGNATINSSHNFNSVTFYPNAIISNGGTFNEVLFMQSGLINNNNTFGNITFSKNGTINGSNAFDKLILSKGYSYKMQSGQTQTINEQLYFWGDADNLITLEASTPGTQATVYMEDLTVSGNYIQLKDMEATGTAIYNLYNSQDNGNNTGWNFLDEPTLTCHADIQVCINITPFELADATPQGGIYSGDGVYFNDNTQTYLFDPTIAGVGEATINYEMNILGLFPKDCDFTITVKALPIASCPDNMSVCIGSEYIDLTGGDGIYRLDGEIITGFNPEQAGIYNITYTETNECGDSQCGFTIEVLALPVIEITGVTNFCANESSELTATVGVYYLWNTEETTQSITVATAQQFSVVVTDANGCKGSAAVDVTLKEIPEVSCPVDFSVLCDANAIILNAIIPQGGIFSGDGVSFDEVSGNYLFTPNCETIGEIVISFAFTGDNECSNYCSFIITTLCNPDNLTEPLFQSVAPVCFGDVIAELPTVSTNGIEGSWLPAINNSETTSYTFTPDAGICATTAEITIIVNKTEAPQGEVEQTFSSATTTLADIIVAGENIQWYASLSDAISNENALDLTTLLVNNAAYFASQTIAGCRSHEFLEVTVVLSTNLLQIAESIITVYPNPAKDVVIISGYNNIESAGLYSISGQKLIQAFKEGNLWKINVSELSQATYILKINTPIGTINKLVIKE